MSNITRAIEYIEDCRHSHVWWSEHLASDPALAADPEPQGGVGDIAHHDMWVERYDAVLKILRREQETMKWTKRFYLGMGAWMAVSFQNSPEGQQVPASERIFGMSILVFAWPAFLGYVGWRELKKAWKL